MTSRDAPASPTSRTRPEILVGTDGSASAAAALQYALAEGERSGAPVRIVHVVPRRPPIPPFMAEAVLDAGQDLLLDVARRAQLAAPQVEVRTSLLVGSRREELVSAANDAGLVVLGRSGRLSHLATGSTAAAIVEHSSCPVRVVPPDWRQRGTRSEVVVAVKDIATSHRLVARGFEIAAALGEPVVVLHAWGLPSGYEDLVGLEAAETWNQQLAQRIENDVKTIRTEFPDVPFQVRTQHARTAVALEEASQRASFLLLGRPSHHVPLGPLNGLTRVIMNLSECPVEVGAEPSLPPPELNLRVEANGRMLK